MPSNTLNQAYFGHTYGLRDRPFRVEWNPAINTLQDRAKDIVKYLLQVQNGHIIFGANIAAMTVQIFQALEAKHVCFGRHELKWNAKLFRWNTIAEEDFTFSNRFFSDSTLGKTVLEQVPSDFSIEGKGTLNQKDIYYTSVISRLSGERLMTPQKYQELKQTYPHLTIIVDYAQTIWALIEDVTQFSDIALWVSSKFIGANPHLWFAWISPEMLEKFPQLGELNSIARPDYMVDYAGLIHHGENIREVNEQWVLSEKILEHRRQILTILESHWLSPIVSTGQPNHFITFAPSSRKYTKQFEIGMRKKWIILSTTLWKWSFDERWISPRIRMGVNYETTDADILAFDKALV
jgi:hypothetical protein